jgi:hypothetical protein
VRPEGLNQGIIPVTPLEIETATFRLVAQCLNELHHGVLHIRFQSEKSGRNFSVVKKSGWEDNIKKQF